jgi:DNA-binding NarL/FixJ family response regulator
MKTFHTIIVALPGSWQKMIQRNLEVYPSVKVVGIAQGSLSAVQLAKEHHPDLMLIDSSIPFEDALALVQKFKKEKPETQSIVITDTTQQRRRITRAGADYTLPSFDFDSRLGEILEQINGTNVNIPDSSMANINEDSHKKIS